MRGEQNFPTLMAKVVATVGQTIPIHKKKYSKAFHFAVTQIIRPPADIS